MSTQPSKDADQAETKHSNDDTSNSEKISSNTHDESMDSQSCEKDEDCKEDSDKKSSDSSKPSIPTMIRPTVHESSHEDQISRINKDLENMVLKYARSERENLENKQKLEDLDKRFKRAIKDNDQLANRIKILTNDKNHLNDTLSAKVAQLTVLEQKKTKLDNSQILQLKENEETIANLRTTNEELLAKIQSYKSREGELLDFSERLSMKHMMLQTELEETLKKGPNYKELYELALVERDKLVTQIDDLTKQLDSMSKTITDEQSRNRNLLKSKNEIEESYQKRIEVLENEMKVLRRKHGIILKELRKETKLLKGTDANIELEDNTHKLMTN